MSSKTPEEVEEINRLGREALEEILRDPTATCYPNRYGGEDIIVEEGHGVRVGVGDAFMGFREPVVMELSDKNGFSSFVTSSPCEYDQLCTEILYDGEFVASISREGGTENALIELWKFKHGSIEFDFERFFNRLIYCFADLVKDRMNEKFNDEPIEVPQVSGPFEPLPVLRGEEEYLARIITPEREEIATLIQHKSQKRATLKLYNHTRLEHWCYKYFDFVVALERARTMVQNMRKGLPVYGKNSPKIKIF